jgi:hypothetical protein
LSGFLYFIPADVTRAEQLGGFALSYAFAAGAPGFSCVPCTGPGGVRGTVVGDDRGGMIVGYYSEKQTWRKMAGGGCHVGMYNERRPMPEELLTAAALAGHAVRLADGNLWTIPAAIAWFSDAGAARYLLNLPQVMDVDEEGRPKPGAVVARYEELWRHAMAFYNAFFSAAPTRDDVGDTQVLFDYAAQMDSACIAIAANYRVGIHELALLGALDDCVAIEVLKAMIDLPTFERICKKKGKSGEANGGGCSTSAGDADLTPSTGPPAPT